jgi:hypothetical protein
MGRNEQPFVHGWEEIGEFAHGECLASIPLFGGA